MNGKELIPINNGADLVDIHDQALLLINQGIEAIKQAKTLLKNNFGNYADYIFTTDVRDYSFSDGNTTHLKKEIENNMKKNFWTHVVNRTNLKKFLSVKRKEELDRNLTQNAKNLPDVSIETLYSFIESNMSQAGDFLQEAIIEVFNFLRPNWKKYKTNKVETIGERVILDCVRSFNMISQYWAQRFSAMETLFYMMDGKASPEYPDDISTKMRDNRDGFVDSEYFTVKLYKKGSAHITFKRMDLVAKINQVAGKALLSQK